MNLILIGCLFIVAFILQYIFSFMQMKSFKSFYNRLRKEGRVVIGTKKGALRAGAISMFSIDEEDRIISGAYLQGVTVLSRFRNFEKFNRINIGTITKNECEAVKLSPSLTKAVLNGVENYKKALNGEEIEMPDSPLVKLTKKVKINNN